MRKKSSNSVHYKLKLAYQDTDIVEKYEKIRFQNLPGKIFQHLQKRSIGKAIDRLEEVTKILDLPCGTGRLTKFLFAKGYKVIGLDISEAMLRYASKKMGDCEQFALGSAEYLCFKDSSVDCVISFRFFCHVDSDIRVEILKEMKRVSKRWIIITNVYLTPYTRLRRRLKKIAGLNYGHWRSVRFPYTPAILTRELQVAGLKLSRIAWTNKILSEEAYFILEKI